MEFRKDVLMVWDEKEWVVMVVSKVLICEGVVVSVVVEVVVWKKFFDLNEELKVCIMLNLW